VSVERTTRLDPWTGCVVGCETGVAVVSTELGEVRATYSGRMLGKIARDRGCAVQTGDRVVLRRWPDNKVTIEDVAPRVEACADVIELHPR
jgi:co-chaperonin GroES (HSP10)